MLNGCFGFIFDFFFLNFVLFARLSEKLLLLCAAADALFLNTLADFGRIFLGFTNVVVFFSLFCCCW